MRCFVCKKISLLWCFLFVGVSVVAAPHSSTPASGKYNLIIEKVAQKYDLPAKLIHSIIKAESNYNPYAVSSKGAAGLMQLMPATAEQYGVKDRFDPSENIEGGTKYLKDLIKIYDKNLELILAAYNAGQEAIKKYKGIPPYPETINYIEKVKSSYGRQDVHTRTIIYTYRDKEGRLVLTNNRALYNANKKRKN
jgi:soluble lytic murein transglycosylase-like protein